MVDQNLAVVRILRWLILANQILPSVIVKRNLFVKQFRPIKFFPFYKGEGRHMSPAYTR